jgi:hypothetical protein
MPSLTFPFDPIGNAATNKVSNEKHALTIAAYRDFHFIVPQYGPYFGDSLVISIKDINNQVRELTRGIDYYPTHWFMTASRACVKEIFGSIGFLDLTLSGEITITYQTVGGDWVIDDTQIAQILSDRIHNPRVTSWETVADIPYAFPVIDHAFDIVDLTRMGEVKNSLDAIADAIITKTLVSAGNQSAAPAVYEDELYFLGQL